MPPPTNKGLAFPPEPLTPAEVRTLLRAIPLRSNSGCRLRALVGVLYGAGLRVQEALDLRPRDVDLDTCQVTVRAGKGGKRRVVAVDPFSCSLLAAWLDRRATLGLTGRHPVFATYSEGAFGHPWDQREARRSLARAGDRAGLTKRVHPHGLRHSHAVLLARTQPLHVVQRQLGHARLDSTQTYISHLSAHDLSEHVAAAFGNWMGEP
jgi:integrase